MARSSPRRLSHCTCIIPVLEVSGRRGARLRSTSNTGVGPVETEAARSAHPDEPLSPRHTERLVASRTTQRLRRLAELGAVPAARAHGVFLAPLRREVLRVAR